MLDKGAVRRIPLVRIVIPFIAGIVISIHVSVPLYISIFVCFFLVTLYFAIVFLLKFEVQYRLRIFSGVIIYCIFIFLGILVAGLHKTPEPVLDNQDKTVHLAKIIEPLSEKEKTFKTVLLIQNRLYKKKATVKVIAYLQKDTVSGKLEYGDMIFFNSVLSRINNSGNPYAFDIRKYNNRKGIYYSTYIKRNEWRKINKLRSHSLRSSAYKINKYLLGMYERSGLKGDELAVISALTLGYKEDLSEEVKNTFTKAGGIHVLAISGLHVGIIYFVLHFIFGFLKRKKAGKILFVLIIIIFLWIFAIVTGFSSSVVRASTMFTFVVIGSVIGRKADIYNNLAAAAFIILLFDPYQLTNIGFQLSFLAVLSIVFFQPLLYKWLIFKNYLLDKIWILITVSVSAQIGTFPLTIYYFKTFPVYFWITNILLIPLVTLAVYLALMLLLNMLFIPKVTILSVLIKYVLKLKILWVKFISDLPYSSIDNINCDLTLCICLYLLIFMISMFCIHLKKKYLYINIGILIVLMLLNFIRHIHRIKQKELIVYNIPGKYAIDLTSGNNNIFITNIKDVQNSKEFNIFVRNNWINKGVCRKSGILYFGNDGFSNNYEYSDFVITDTIFGNLILNFNNKSVLILENEKYKYHKTNNPFLIDYVIITANLYPDIEKLIRLFKINKIVLNNSISDWHKNQWIQICKENELDYYSVKDSGALKENSFQKASELGDFDRKVLDVDKKMKSIGFYD